MHVLVNGAESTGVRIARILAAARVQISLTKHSVRPDDPRTREILFLQKEFGPIQVYLAPGDDLESRLYQARRMGFSALALGQFEGQERPDAIIDCTYGHEPMYGAATLITENLLIPLLLVEGARKTTAAKRFVSTPNSRSGLEWEGYLADMARHADPEAAMCATMIGLAMEHIDPDRIAGIDIGIRKSYSGPGERNPWPLRSTEFEHVMSTKTDIQYALPGIEDKLRVRSNRNPWNHYDRYDITIALMAPLGAKEQDSIIAKMRSYERLIYTGLDLGGSTEEMAAAGAKAVKDACEMLHIPGSDSLLPTANVWFPSATAVLIGGYIPNRCAIALSASDWLLAATGLADSIQKASAATNSAEWYGYRIPELKLMMEGELTRNQKPSAEQTLLTVSPNVSDF